MAKVVILGGGFGGVVVAESLAKKLEGEHEITLVSRSHNFVFYPALVRLAFGQCEPEDVEFDLRKSMVDRRVRFVEAEVARIYPDERLLTFAHGDFIGDMPFDYLVIALGRRLKTELVTGFFEHAHHLLSVHGARKFRKAVDLFREGRALIGHCAGARLPVPLFETAVALSQRLKERGDRSRCEIAIVSEETLDEMFAGVPMSEALSPMLRTHDIKVVSNFSISKLDSSSIFSTDGRVMDYNLNMIIPPFGGPAPLLDTEVIDREGYVQVDSTMGVVGLDRIYAVGDCVNFAGPKLGHMAVQQAEIAAENLVAEIQGKPRVAHYDPELMLVIDAAGNESTFVHKNLWEDRSPNVQNSRFWGWAKRRQEQFWLKSAGESRRAKVPGSAGILACLFGQAYFRD